MDLTSPTPGSEVSALNSPEQEAASPTIALSPTDESIPASLKEEVRKRVPISCFDLQTRCVLLVEPSAQQNVLARRQFPDAMLC